MNKKKLIISLIVDDLTNERLISGLTELGIDASAYYLSLRETILNLMGYKTSWEGLHDHYIQLSLKVHEIEAPMPYKEVYELAKEMYRQLKNL